MLKKVLIFIKSFVKAHKFISLIILTTIILGGYFIIAKLGKKDGEVKYVTQAVSKGMLISSISGTGQVSASDQVDVKAKSSGEITAVYMTAGQEVKNGQILAQIDASDAYKSVRDAQTALETTQLELEELLEPIDELTLMQSENSLISAKESKQNAEDNLAKSYEDGFNSVANAFLDLPSVMTGLNNVLFNSSYTSIQTNLDYYANVIKTYNYNQGEMYLNDADNKYQTAKAAYDKNFENYKNTSRFSDEKIIEGLIVETYETIKNIAEAIKSANNLVQLYQDKLTAVDSAPATLSNTHLSNLSSYTSKTNSYVTSLLSAKNSIQNYKDSIVSAERSIKEKELSLAKTQAGADELTLRSKKLAVQQKQDALASAQETLYDCSVRAPFTGMVAEVSAKKGETASNGTNIATLITNQKISEITLNEIDVAQVKVGQPAILTFDAVSELSITGEVVEVDTLGTVSSGVVNYGVKIAFDIQDERIKPGMSVSVNIITESKLDVLLVPLGAVKTSGTQSYVEVMVDGQIQRKTVILGSSNDIQVEIISGLDEGQEIITQTISTASSTQNSSNTTQNRNTGFGAGEFRMLR